MVAIAVAAERKRVEEVCLGDAGRCDDASMGAGMGHADDELFSLWRQAMRDCGEDIPE